MKAYIPISIRVLIAILFILSAVAKLYPSPNLALGTFEAKQLFPMGFSEGFAPYFSRSLIAVEFALGIAILQPHYLKKLVVPATTALLAVFCVHLTYSIVTGAGGNCGCFGELIPMTPTQALIKNIISIGLLAYLYKLLPSDSDSHKKMSNLLLIFTTIGLFMFAFAPVQSASVTPTVGGTEVVHSDFATNGGAETDIVSDSTSVNDTSDVENPIDGKDPEVVKPKGPKHVQSKYRNYTDFIPSNVNIDDGKKILCFFAPTCDHCMETAKTLTEMRNEISGFPPVHIVFMDEGPEEIPNFFKFAGREYSYRIAGVIKFWEMIGNAYDTPGVVYLHNGNVMYFADGINDNAFDAGKLKAAIDK